ncbi:reprolysin-like metallopeptidase [Pseudomonas fulva]|uniref:reprolysin-like metallopeptidase n=1 Tax=Pseudomonas fulva TaxID=47880 RepID=UPI003EEFE249
MKRRAWFISMALFLTACTGLPASDRQIDAFSTQPLFDMAKPKNMEALKQNKGTYGLLNDVLQDPATEDVQWVDVDASLINEATKTLSVRLGQGKAITFRQRRSDPPAPGMVGWVGDSVAESEKKADTDIDFNPLTWISIVRDGEQLAGAIHIEGVSYNLHYVGAGQHVVVKVNEAKRPVEQATDLEHLQQHAVAGKAPRAASSTISVLFFATNERRTKDPSYRATIARVVQDANQVMTNSQAPVTVSIAGFIELDYAEGDKTGVDQFMDFRTPGRDLNNQVRRWRDYFSADVVTLYTSYSGTGGEVATGGYVIVGSADSFAHEMGHVLGARHTWDGSSEGYNYGYKRENPTFHTTMVINWGAIPYFSNPRLSYQGVPIGTVAHHDVARTINENRERVENTYDPFRGVELTLYSGANLQGSSCPVSIRFSSPVNIASQCPGQAVRSFKVSGFEKGQMLCFYDGPGERSSCFHETSGVPPENFEVLDIDRSHAPPGLIRKIKGSELAGNVVDVLYGTRGVLLFGAADFKNPLCGFGATGQDVSIADQAGCAGAAGLARSARIFHENLRGPDRVNACFFNNNHSRSLCFEGNYNGKFGVANFDSARGIPPELKRTQTGSYMNGSVHRYQHTN